MKNLMITTALAFGLLACENTTVSDETGPAEASGVNFTGANDNTQTTPGVTTSVTGNQDRLTGNETENETSTEPVNDPVETEAETETDPVETETPTETTGLEDEVTLDDLTEVDLEDIEELRANIFEGLDVGKELYIQQVNLALDDLGLFNGNQLLGENESLPDVSSCPFVEYYENTKPLTEASCEYLVDQARSDAYSKLAAALQTSRENFNSSESEKDFWYEQGALSGLEKTRVLIQVELKTKQVCNQTPTSKESSYEKGLVVGRQHFINSMNNWLATNGYKSDYPVMSDPIEVCTANSAMLDPVYDDAVNTISQAVTSNPLCKDYQPVNTDDELAFGQAQGEFTKAIEQGVADEFALAAVKIFEVVPCNVSDPLIVDVNLNGKFDVSPVHKGVNFNLTGNRVQPTAWLNGDGFLFYDVNKNGIVDDGTEFFGTNRKYSSGFEHLQTLDTNKDGIIDRTDAGYRYLNVWVDKNSDGVSTKDEVQKIYKLGLEIPTSSFKFIMDINGSTLKSQVWGYSRRMGKILVGDVDLRVGTWERTLASR